MSLETPKPSSEAGFTLIQALVSVAVLSLCVGLFFKARNSSQNARKNIDSASMITDVNEALVTELSTVIRQVNATTPGCLDFAAQLTNRPLAKASGSSSLTFTTNVAQPQAVSSGLSDKERASLQSQLTQDVLKPAVNRCRSQRQPPNPNQPNSNVFYLCMNIKQDTDAPQGSFLNAPFAFAEVGWQLVNLQTGANMSCSEFAAAQKSAGARVYYSVYWAVPVTGTVTVKKHINSFTMGK